MKGSRSRPIRPPDVDPWSTATESGTDQDLDPWNTPALDARNDEIEHDPWQQSSHPSQALKRKRFVELQAGAKMLAAGSRDKQTFNSYEQKGMDPQIVKRRWASKCPRGCKLPGCAKQALRLADLQDLSQNFWRISAQERVQLLQAQFGDDPDAIPEYYIGSLRVCLANFCAKLGTSLPTFRKLIKGVPDMRGKGMKHVKENMAEASTKCDHFFQELHQSAAEALPEDERCAMSLDGDPWNQAWTVLQFPA